jgi:hypothetical protein
MSQKLNQNIGEMNMNMSQSISPKMQKILEDAYQLELSHKLFVAGIETLTPSLEDHNNNLEYINDLMLRLRQSPKLVCRDELYETVKMLYRNYGYGSSSILFNLINIMGHCGFKDKRVKVLTKVIPDVVQQSWRLDQYCK